MISYIISPTSYLITVSSSTLKVLLLRFARDNKFLNIIMFVFLRAEAGYRISLTHLRKFQNESIVGKKKSFSNRTKPAAVNQWPCTYNTRIKSTRNGQSLKNSALGLRVPIMALNCEPAYVCFENTIFCPRAFSIERAKSVIKNCRLRNESRNIILYVLIIIIRREYRVSLLISWPFAGYSDGFTNRREM